MVTLVVLKRVGYMVQTYSGDKAYTRADAEFTKWLAKPNAVLISLYDEAGLLVKYSNLREVV